MVLTLDPTLCYRDSPQLRADMAVVEQSLDRFSESMKKIVAVGKKLLEAEKGGHYKKKKKKNGGKTKLTVTFLFFFSFFFSFSSLV